MGDWGWVALAMGLTYVGLASYAWSLRRRTLTARKRLEDLR